MKDYGTGGPEGRERRAEHSVADHLPPSRYLSHSDKIVSRLVMKSQRCCLPYGLWMIVSMDYFVLARQ